jgi:hypothetical protein
VSADHSHGHSQRIEAHLRDVNHRGSVLAVLETRAAAKKRIADTFGSNPSLVIVYLGRQKGMTQPEVVRELKGRNLPGGSQPQVSVAEAKLEEAGFLMQPPKGRRVVLEGWEEFGLNRALNKILNDHRVPKLG